VVLQTVDPVVQVPGLEWSVLVVIVAAVHVFALIAATVSVLRSERLAPGGRLLWIAVFLLLPFVGALAWFLWGRHARLDRPVG
jgi:hypothetical protein